MPSTQNNTGPETTEPPDTRKGGAPNARPPKGTNVREGDGMGANTNENLRVGQHRVSDHDADNRGGKPQGTGKNKG